MSKLTQRQNIHSKELISSLESKKASIAQELAANDKEARNLQKYVNKYIAQGVDPAEVNLKAMKEAQQALKALVFKTAKSICSLEDFHIKLHMHPPPENIFDVQVKEPIVNSLELSRNMQYCCKLNVKGQQGPIKLKIEYIHLETGQPLTKALKIQLKGMLNFYISLINKNP